MKRTLTFAVAAMVLQPAVAMAEEASEQGPLAALSWMEGRWRGEAKVLTRQGPITLTQTERSGEMLNGRVRLVEGKGYAADGSVAFNALGVIAPTASGGIEMRSWTLEQAGSFAIEIDQTGFHWEIPAGPGAVIRYVASFDGTTWTETGHRLVEGQPPMETFRMTLTKVDDTDWPAGGALDRD